MANWIIKWRSTKRGLPTINMNFQMMHMHSSIQQRMQNRHLVIRSEQTLQVLKVSSRSDTIPRVPPTPTASPRPPTDDCHGRSARSVDTVQAGVFQRPRVLDGEFAASHRESHRGGRDGVLQCRATARSRAVRSTVRSTSTEAELTFICFDDLLNNAEDVICTVVDNILAKHGDKTRDEPSFQAPEWPFLRTTHADSIKHSKEHGHSTRGSLCHW